MDKNKLKFLVSGLLVGLAVSSHAVADIVFDPANFVKNTITSMQQVQQTAIQLDIKAQEVRQYMLMVQNLKKLNPSVIQRGVDRGIIPAGTYSTPGDVVNAARGVYGTYEKIGQTMKAYDTSYGGINTVMKDLDRTSIRSKVPAEKIIQYDFQRAQKGIEQDTNYYSALQDLNLQIANHQKRTDSLASAIPAQSGTVELLQTIGTQNTVLQDQLTHLIQVNSMSAAQTIQNSKDQKTQLEQDARSRDEALRANETAGNYFSPKK